LLVSSLFSGCKIVALPLIGMQGRLGSQAYQQLLDCLHTVLDKEKIYMQGYKNIVGTLRRFTYAAYQQRRRFNKLNELVKGYCKNWDANKGEKFICVHTKILFFYYIHVLVAFYWQALSLANNYKLLMLK
jgi:hypothetical protein